MSNLPSPFPPRCLHNHAFVSLLVALTSQGTGSQAGWRTFIEPSEIPLSELSTADAPPLCPLPPLLDQSVAYATEDSLLVVSPLTLIAAICSYSGVLPRLSSGPLCDLLAARAAGAHGQNRRSLQPLSTHRSPAADWPRLARLQVDVTSHLPLYSCLHPPFHHTVMPCGPHSKSL